MDISKLKERLSGKRLLAENMFFISAAPLLNALIGLLIYPYVIRALGIENYGTFAFVFNIVLLITNLINAPFILPFGREVALHNISIDVKSEIFSKVFFSKLFITAITSLLFILVLWLLPLEREQVVLALVTYISVLATPFTPNWYYQAIQKSKIITYIQLSIRVLSVPFILLFVKSGEDLIIYALISALCALSSSVASYIWLRISEKIEIAWVSISTIISSIKTTMPTFKDVAADVTINQLSGVIIGASFGMVEMAFYDLAAKITQILQSGYNGINSSLMPHIMSKGEERGSRRFLLFDAAIGVASIVAITILGPFVIRLLGGDGMEGAYFMTVMLTVAITADFISNGVIYLILVPEKRYREIPYSRYASLVAFIILASAASFMNADAVVISILAANIIRMSVSLWQTRNKIKKSL